MIQKLILIILVIFTSSSLLAQRIAADKIIGKVGNTIILQSDIDGQFNEAKRENPDLEDSVKCSFLYNVLAQQILVEQAERDSIYVTDEEVENVLDDRVRYWLQQYGGRETLEEISGKSIYQLKEENRKFFKDKLTAERIQSQIMTNVKITPREIEDFYRRIPTDSLPPIPATVELGQIIVKPDYNPELEQYAKEKLEGIRKDIVEGGRSFSSMAAIYSMDGTKDNGGELTINKKQFDPQFVSAAYRLQPGEISPVIRSKFGYHIIQMVKRVGEEAQVRHIIIVPEITTVDLNKTIESLDTLYRNLKENKISFQEAVAKYSTDDKSKMTGGIYYNDMGNSTIQMEEMDPLMAQSISELKVGEFSKPHIFTDQMNQRSCRILFLKSRKDPHVLNMKDDYSIIKQMAEGEKQMNYLQKYITERLSAYYISIDPEFKECSELKEWFEIAVKN